MKKLLTFILLTVLLLGSCGRRSGKGVSSSEVPAEPETLPVATFTSSENMSSLSSQDNEEEWDEANRKYVDGCYYTGDTSTPFLASFAERWNRTTFLRRFVHAEELFERLNTNYGDSLTTETVRGQMPMLENEFELAFRNPALQAQARELVRMLTTIDYVPAECEKMATKFQQLANQPFETPDFISDQEIKTVRDVFWTAYDKSPYVDDIAKIQKVRVAAESGSDELEKMRISLQDRFAKETDFDARCILAIEMGCCDQVEDIVDVLGGLIEAGRYSKYLLEVWLSWRLRAQSMLFGVSTFSEIPDNLYDKARLLVAQNYLRHIGENPDDTLAKMLLMNLTYTENLHRYSSYFGNAALGAELFLKKQYFLPDSLTGQE